MKSCHRCRASWEGFGEPRFREQCESCGAYVRCCRNCAYFDLRSVQCRIPEAMYVGDRQMANYCEEFEFADSQAVAFNEKTQHARVRWHRLFH